MGLCRGHRDSEAATPWLFADGSSREDEIIIATTQDTTEIVALDLPKANLMKR